jgi:hypothetical protein
VRGGIEWVPGEEPDIAGPAVSAWRSGALRRMQATNNGAVRKLAAIVTQPGKGVIVT